ncbi:CD83 antigen [Gouania willdenowi]|uniref:Ig-like domain-containing protein n=1 Tax=Gouania willdenowi TaxID=441366 RepID=A0A8C5ENI4_GOUWI|nr:CD83 antigen [Gouania willdenowi]
MRRVWQKQKIHLNMRWMMIMIIMMMMMLVLMNFGGAQSDRNVSSECNQNVSLPCSGTISSMEVFSVNWVKIDGETNQSIIRKSKSGIQRYNQRGAELGDEYHLLLSAVTPDDSGTYECLVKAAAGGQNVKNSVLLKVKGCATSDQALLNSTPTTPPSEDQDQVKDLPLVWSIFISVCVAGGKIILSLTCIWFFHQRSTRKKKKEHQSSRRRH